MSFRITRRQQRERSVARGFFDLTRCLAPPSAPSARSVVKSIADARCPNCDVPYNSLQFEVVLCPRCHTRGSTFCCNPGGDGCLCVECLNETGRVHFAHRGVFNRGGDQ